MAYRITKNILTGNPEVVIDGFEKGIADSPYEGIADMRNVNITSSPKQATVMYATAAASVPPTGFTGVSFSSTAATDIFTTASTTGFYNGMGLTIVTVSGGGSGTAGMTYYVSNITPTTFKLNTDLGFSNILDITTDRTGTFTVQTFGTPCDSVSAPSTSFNTSDGRNFRNTFITTTDGLVWYISYMTALISMVQFLGNLLHSTAGAPNFGVTVFKNYLMVFQNTKIDYLPLTVIDSSTNPSSVWVYAWQDINDSFTGHRAISGIDGAMYFCDGSYVGSLLEVEGMTFNPTDVSTYTYNPNALYIKQSGEQLTCLAELGQQLLIGGIQNNVYTWDRISTGYGWLVVAEPFITCIVSTNSSAYIFAGIRGRIYLTNGANIQLWKKIPDYLTGTQDPYYNWNWAIYWKNQIYFTMYATTNAAGGNTVVISNFAGLWAIDLNTEAFRLTNSLSYGTYAGTVPTIVNMGGIYQGGDGIYACWSNSTTGIDYTVPTPYTNYQSRIDSDIMNIGGYLTKNTFSNIEYKLGRVLITGEKVKLSWRSNLSDSFVQIGETTTAGQLSDNYSMNFENVQWLQIRIETSSTATNPSYVPLESVTFRQT